MFVECDGRHRTELADRQLQKEDGDAKAEQHDDVGDEEGAAAVLVAQVRKPPHVAQTCGTQTHGVVSEQAVTRRLRSYLSLARRKLPISSPYNAYCMSICGCQYSARCKTFRFERSAAAVLFPI